MKYLFILLFFISANAQAQKLEIIIVGVSHNYGKYPAQNFSDIHDKLIRFKPDAFFGEFLDKKDERLLMDYWCKADNNKRLETLTKNRALPEAELPSTIDSLKSVCLSNPADYRAKVDLAHAYYLEQDAANGHYQYWKVFDHLRKKEDTALQNYLDQILSPKFDTTGRSMKRLQTSEYSAIAFPVMQQLGIQELLSMDCQDYDLNWNASWAAVEAKLKQKRTDPTSPLKKEMAPFFATMNSGFAKYDTIEKTSNNVTQWLNTEEASAISASGDFYLPEMYRLKDFPNEQMQSKIHWWIMRNRGMCENVVSRAKAKGARKVVVIAGANHRKYMQDIFAAMPEVSVRNINEVK